MDGENIESDKINSDEEEINAVGESALYMNHGEKFKAVANKGKMKGNEIYHYKCNHCSRVFMCPGSGTFLEHIRKVHPKKAPELVPLKAKPLIRDFFSKAKMKIPFNEDIAVGKLLKWIVKTDQPITIVDNEHFQDFINYLKNDINLVSRRTIMRRLEDMYLQKIQEVNSKLNTLSSKFSVTCDVWTSKNQLSFFGFTIHYIDDEWKLQENLLTFKFLEAKAFDYPILSAMAKDYLTVQASSVPAERAFSSGVDLVTANRLSLSGRTIEMTQFLKFVL